MLRKSLFGTTVIAVSVSAAIAAVDQPESASEAADVTVARAAFERDMEIDYPENNLPNTAREELGKALFFDPRLSRSGGQSCASCHNPAFAWGDGLAVGVGDHLAPLGRRSPSILNLAWGEPLMWDGRADSLEEQALGPMQASVEMNMDMQSIITRLEAIEGYRGMFAAAFDGDSTIDAERIGLAVASFERTIISGMAPFDLWVEGDETAISAEAVRGFELFVGKANCASCHEGWRFTDDSFHDIGLDDDDVGRGAFFETVTVLQYAFKTPGLRNMTQRAPYMHDGRIATLRGVIEHYNTAGINRPSRSEEIYPLNLDDAEIDALVAFLETLTSDDPAVTIPVLPH